MDCDTQPWKYNRRKLQGLTTTSYNVHDIFMVKSYFFIISNVCLKINLFHVKGTFEKYVPVLILPKPG